MEMERSSGILMHITSLPSQYGIGDFGPSAYQFADFLYAAGQKYWQILPLNPTELYSGNSPYSSPSAFAGNVLLISPELLVQDGFLNEEALLNSPQFEDHKVEFPEVVLFKKQILNDTYEKFKRENLNEEGFREFCHENSSWLDDYAFYMALKQKYGGKSWTEWPVEIRDRQQEAMAAHQEEVIEVIEKEKFLQFLFFQQWDRLHNYCKNKDVQFIGDIPYYVSHDSSDVWANSMYFKLNEYKQPTMVSGVPPDYFSETGQLWGTPVFAWDRLAHNNFDWWVRRIRQNLRLYNVVRIDHFRAFSAYWEVPADLDTAINGHWEKCPGIAFFELLQKEFPELPFIAEDLGTLDEGVFELIRKFHLPGMKVLLFAFGEGMNKNPYIPHHHIPNSIVYTGTHDNTTVRGWFSNASKEEKRRFSIYTDRQVNLSNINEVMQRMALMSVAKVIILPIQDILGLGEEAIMNRPSTGSGNWAWRLPFGKLTIELANKLKLLNQLYDRLGKGGTRVDFRGA